MYSQHSRTGGSGPSTDYSKGSHAPTGVGRTVAYALAVLGMDAVQRSTIRALLPKGETKPRGPAVRQRKLRGEYVSTSKNKTSHAFQATLQRYERWGWLDRSPDLVHVRDRAALLRHALQGQHTAPQELLDIRGALEAIRAEQRAVGRPSDDALREQRRREMKALMNLMHAPAPAPGAVRIVHKSRLI